MLHQFSVGMSQQSDNSILGSKICQAALECHNSSSCWHMHSRMAMPNLYTIIKPASLDRIKGESNGQNHEVKDK